MIHDSMFLSFNLIVSCCFFISKIYGSKYWPCRAW